MDPAFVRSERIVFPDGTRPATILIAGGRIAAVRAIDDGSSRRRRHRRGQSGGPARPGGHARPRQRAGPDRVGRLRTRDAGGGGRRRHDARGHAPQQPAGNRGRGRPGRQGARERGPDSRRRRDSGAAWFRGTPPPSSRWSAAGVLGFKCFLAPSGVDEFPHVASRGPARGGANPGRGCGCRCWFTRSCPRSCASPTRAPIRAPIAPGSTRAPKPASGPPSNG